MSRFIRKFCGLQVFSALLFLTTFPAWADWVNLSGAEVAPNIAEIYVEDDGVRVVLEIYVGDLEDFADLIPATWYDQSKVVILPDNERLQRFAFEGLTIADSDGALLPVELRTVERRKRIDRRSPFAGMVNPLTGVRAPQAPEDKRVLYAELFYHFTGGPLERLTFTPPMNQDGVPRASIGMIVFHRKVPVIDFRFFSGAATLTLDWDDPWYSRFDQPNLIRHHRYPMMSFLYAEAYEIRHEALLRVRDASRLIGLQPAERVLTGAEAERLKAKAAATVKERSPMTIDGKPVTADFDRAAFMRIGLRGLEFLAETDPIDVDSTILGLIYSVPTDGYPKQATVEWTIFDDRIRQVPGNAIDAAGPFLSGLTPDDPVLTWTNHFKRSPVPPVTAVDSTHWSEIRLPALSISLWIGAFGLLVSALRGAGAVRRLGRATLAAVCIAGGLVLLPFGAVSVSRPGIVAATMTEEQSAELAKQLLRNVYRAFDFRGERQVYDRLAKTVDGTLLEQVYLDQRRSLRVARAGGAVARVKSIRVESAKPERVPGTAADFTIRTRWIIVGTVGHWGHVHQRSNLYEADLTISAANGAWKITDFEVLGQERLSM
jgi:hypothetical protein